MKYCFAFLSLILLAGCGDGRELTIEEYKKVEEHCEQNGMEVRVKHYNMRPLFHHSYCVDTKTHVTFKVNADSLK